jgi:hypothetical protein
MFTVELYAKIRHAVMIDGLSRREAAKRFGVHRNTITKMLSFSVPPGDPNLTPGGLFDGKRHDGIFDFWRDPVLQDGLAP